MIKAFIIRITGQNHLFGASLNAMIIQTLATCHNRKAKTLLSLRDLHQQELRKEIILQHTIVDDGSTDGTSEVISEIFPRVEIIYGTGNLFWAGGMRLGWEESIQEKKFDFLFVYNDDARFEASALEKLLKTSDDFLKAHGPAPLAIAGAFTDHSLTRSTYGGVILKHNWNPFSFTHTPPSSTKYKIVDSLNMNGALINKDALTKVGFLSSFFVHGGADFEFGLKLRRQGGFVLLSPGYIGTCDKNTDSQTSKDLDLTLLQGFRRLIGPKELPPRQRFSYCRRYAPILWPAFWIYPYLSYFVKRLSSWVRKK